MKAPVFVVGCPRSGNHLVYHSLLSSGGFAVYEIHSHVFNILGRKFGDLRILENRQKLMDAWLRGWLFMQTGLEAELIRKRILDECRSAGDFLRIVMEEVCRRQNVDRWAENTPDHVFYLREIKESFPNALFIHVIRDGRDVALSLDKIGWIRPMPWDRNRSWMAGALFWDWTVRKARRFGAELRQDYLEVRFEDVLSKPHETLSKIGSFIHHDLDHDRIQRTAIGSIRKPNTVFEDFPKNSSSGPVGRWQKTLSPKEISEMERQIGPLLRELDYSLATPAERAGFSPRLMRSEYHAFFETKLWLKSHTPLGRLMRAGLIHADTDLPASKD
jgi:Sulfotransferase family